MLDENYLASFADAYYKDGRIWFSNHMFNGLFTYNFESKQSHFVGVFPKAKLNQKILHRKVIKYKDELYFFLNHEMVGVHSFSLVSNQISFINEGIVNCGETAGFITSEVIACGEQAILLPRKFSDGIYIFDFEKKQFVRNKAFFQKLIDDRLVNGEDTIFRLFCDGNIVWIPVMGKNVIIKYLIRQDEIRIMTLDEGLHLLDIYVAEDKMLITQTDKSEVLFYQGDSCLVCSIKEDGLFEKLNSNRGERVFYSRILYENEKFFLLPMASKEVLKVNPQNGEIVSVHIENEEYTLCERTRRRWTFYYGYLVLGKRIFIYPNAGNAGVWLDGETERLEIEPITLEDISYVREYLLSEALAKKFSKQLVNKEDENKTLNSFIRMLEMKC